jgi:hypothetical protein
MGHARRIRRSLALGCIAFASLVTSVAFGAGVSPSDATPAQKKDATERFVAGKEALTAKNWDSAVSNLRASLDIVDSPNARLELARALRESGKMVDAWSEYSRTIDSALNLTSKEPRYTKTAEAATAERNEVEPKIALVTVTVEHPPPGAALKVGATDVPVDHWGKHVPVAPGPVEVSLTAGGKELAHKSLTASAGEKQSVALDAAEATPPPPAVSSAPPQAVSAGDSSSSSDHSALRPFAYVAGGLGVAGFTLFAIFGVMSNSTYSDLQNACPHGVCPPGKQSEVDSGRTQQTVANVGLGVGIAGIAAGTALFLYTMPTRTSGPGAALVLGPGYVGVRGSL